MARVIRKIMNPVVTKVFLVLVFLLSFCNLMYADVIEAGYHYVKECTTIVNLETFPDIVLITHVFGVLPPKEPVRIIQPGECVSAGYQLNGMKIYAAEKSYIDSVGLRNIKIYKPSTGWPSIDDENVLLAKIIMNGPEYSRSVPDSNPLIEQDTELSIAGFVESKVILYESKRISKFRGRKPRIQVFEKPKLENLRETFKK
ncbi:MAG: hypothetical protein PHP17_04920 [Candidatus Omnitrophica bacterium]|nr:hypothetical protein [Candidatus Omnitrophota bacterium]